MRRASEFPVAAGEPFSAASGCRSCILGLVLTDHQVFQLQHSPTQPCNSMSPILIKAENIPDTAVSRRRQGKGPLNQSATPQSPHGQHAPESPKCSPHPHHPMRLCLDVVIFTLIHPCVLVWIGMEFSSNSTPIHLNTYELM
jgi:hypothetical protein